MASKSKLNPDVNQPAIAKFITINNSVKRGPSSPPENSPSLKRSIMETTDMEVLPQENQDKLSKLPPDLKLLYDSIKLQLDSLDRKIDRNLSVRIDDVETTQVKTDVRLSRIEQENEELKQRLTEIEDKLLEKSIVVNGITEDKYEKPEPRREKLNQVLANALSGNSYEEKLEKASNLKIEGTERVENSIRVKEDQLRSTSLANRMQKLYSKTKGNYPKEFSLISTIVLKQNENGNVLDQYYPQHAV